jgi:hypothetical protein
VAKTAQVELRRGRVQVLADAPARAEVALRLYRFDVVVCIGSLGLGAQVGTESKISKEVYDIIASSAHFQAG